MTPSPPDAHAYARDRLAKTSRALRRLVHAVEARFPQFVADAAPRSDVLTAWREAKAVLDEPEPPAP